MKKTYQQPLMAAVDVETQRLMDAWSVDSDDLNYGGGTQTGVNRGRHRNLWDDEEDWSDLGL